MSHVVTIKVKLLDTAAVSAAVASMGGTWLGSGVHQMFGGQVAQGHGYQLKGWRYPVVIQADGSLAYDDYNGHWGNPADISRIKQGYAVQVATKAARKQGYRVVGQTVQADGSIRLRVSR